MMRANARHLSKYVELELSGHAYVGRLRTFPLGLNFPVWFVEIIQGPPSIKTLYVEGVGIWNNRLVIQGFNFFPWSKLSTLAKKLDIHMGKQG